jgi:hypothetical protein
MYVSVFSSGVVTFNLGFFSISQQPIKFQVQKKIHTKKKNTADNKTAKLDQSVFDYMLSRSAFSV